MVKKLKRTEVSFHEVLGAEIDLVQMDMVIRDGEKSTQHDQHVFLEVCTCFLFPCFY